MDLDIDGTTGTLDSAAEAGHGGRRYNDIADQLDMDRLGKKQELKRTFRLLSIFSFMCVAMSTWVFTIKYVPLTNILQVPLSTNLTSSHIKCINERSLSWWNRWFHYNLHSQLRSLLQHRPLFGRDGFYRANSRRYAHTPRVPHNIAQTDHLSCQYHWTSEFAHPSAQKFLSYLNGWLLTLSWLCGVASGMFLTGQMAQGAILIRNPDFNAQPYQVWLLVLAFCSLGFLLNTVGAKHLALMELLVAAFFILGYAANLIVFWLMSPKNSATAVFSTFTNGDGWSDYGFGILTAQTAALYLIIGSDGAAHMAEETRDASLNVPRGIIGSYLIGVASGLVMLITFCFCFFSDALDSATGFAFMAVYQNTTVSDSGALALTAILIMLTFFSAVNFMASASRQTYAFARDGMRISRLHCMPNRTANSHCARRTPIQQNHREGLHLL
jgi:choline transport protein